MKFLVCSVDVLPCPVSEQSLYSLADIIAQSIAQIEASEIALAYAFGAGSVLTWWYMGFVISAGIKAIKKIQL